MAPWDARRGVLQAVPRVTGPGGPHTPEGREKRGLAAHFLPAIVGEFGPVLDCGALFSARKQERFPVL